jgi:hypothetical protein
MNTDDREYDETHQGIIGVRIWQLSCSQCEQIRSLISGVLFCELCDTDLGD